jgi:CheY-like chemotaxis protein
MKIFVVDDDPVARMIVLDQLDDPRYTVGEFANGASLLAAMDEKPDLIMLDIEMPVMNGISACRALRQAGHDQVQVIFISAHDDLETRLAAYEAGGSDFVIKPYAAEELTRKVRVAENFLALRRDLSQQSHSAAQTAFTAMSSMGEMGVVLHFLSASFACGDPDLLAQATLNAMHEYDLPCLLQLRLASGTRSYSSKGDCSPLETSILEHAAKMDRIFQFRDRLAINYSCVTLLVLALPLADPDRVGRLRDHLAILTEGANARLNAMEIELRQLAQARGIGQAVVDLTEALEEIGRNQARIRLQSSEIDRRYLEDLGHAFTQIGLSDDQESVLSELAQRTDMRINNLRDVDSSIGEKLLNITEQLRKLTESAA